MSKATGSDGVPFRILFVCTGNTCRSPLAEALARRELERRRWKGVEVASGGVAAYPGEGASAGSLEAAQEEGLDLSGHSSQGVTEELVSWADLILTMSVSHLDPVFHLGGEGRATVLTAFAQGDEELEGDGTHGVLDPFGGDLPRYRATLRELDELVTRTLDRLAPVLKP